MRLRHCARFASRPDCRFADGEVRAGLFLRHKRERLGWRVILMVGNSKCLPFSFHVYELQRRR